MMVHKFKFYCLTAYCMAIISLHVAVTHAMDRIIAVGDSVIDNSGWNKVEAGTTGQWLVEMLNNSDGGPAVNSARVIIDDRSTDEATTASILEALNGDGNIHVRYRYRAMREASNVGYRSESPDSARLPQYCEFDRDRNHETTVNIKEDIEGSYVFISAGGNDLLLNKTYPLDIIENLKKIAEMYKKLGAKKVIYIIPYTMVTNTNGYGYLDWAATGITCGLINLCRMVVKFFYLNHLVPDHYDGVIDLSDFGDDLRLAEYSIPEPTPAGAREIARRIADMYLLLSNQPDQAMPTDSLQSFDGVSNRPDVSIVPRPDLGQ